MTYPPDRRATRKLAFRRAGLAVGGGVLCAGAALVAGVPLAAAIAVVAGVGLALRFLHVPGGVPILVYHSVSPDARWLPWARNTSIRPDVLNAHLSVLRRTGWTIVSTAELIASRTGGPALPDRAVVLHFDDAYLDNYLFAAPILRAHAAPAMIFASLDFITPGDTPRDDAANGGPSEWQGYMNAAELRALDSDPLFAIESHGTDHARIPVSDRGVGNVGADWKPHAPLAWAVEPGDKSRWYEAETPPPALRPDVTLSQTDSALAGRWWRDGGPEDAPAFAARVEKMLIRAHDGLAEILGRAPSVMCWPFDRSDPVSVAAARAAGFTAVTGGRGDNRPGEDATVLSRVHVQDRAFGGGPVWLETLALRARTESASGRMAWHLVVALASRIRRWRLGRSGYGGPAS